MTVDGKKLKLAIWDTGVHSCLLMYLCFIDVSLNSTFLQVYQQKKIVHFFKSLPASSV